MICTGETCTHGMLTRCPFCQREQYGPAVWKFSHGVMGCPWCGVFIDPVERAGAAGEVSTIPNPAHQDSDLNPAAQPQIRRVK